MNKQLTLFLLFSAGAAAGALATAPQYQIADILTADAPSASRSKDWKPGAGIPLEVSGGESYRPLSPRREIKPVPLIFQVLTALGTGTVREKACPVVNTVLAE